MRPDPPDEAIPSPDPQPLPPIEPKRWRCCHCGGTGLDSYAETCLHCEGLGFC
ncbi:hypothetical protein GCM10010156_77380 [Planobispora rosea]|uniref:Uncharacterized protein n=1 Tax=Planobispora rosea TaxID=35762 RepID=A0A8J3S7B6_PLARO|nr:hypothetical protein [Planobispora rosea]GGT08995.1 hypothetical protein GCM10010156_77380 [Planobispora rosea]GIH89287.1 hypothetical protein Pro02_76950 [Planobispora rosea]